MLVLNRKDGERVVIGNCVTLTVLECKNGRVRLGFDAPQDVHILRQELQNTLPQTATDLGPTATTVHHL